MKMFLLLLVVSLTASEKLDRTYLPPPGAKYSGGVPGNIEVPFEFPKYSPTQRPQGTLSNRPVTPEDTEIEVGINRGLGSQTPGVNIDSGLISPSSKAPFDYFQKVPTTTTSYAFTQTTTHPPGESFDTTLGPLNTATGFPITTPFVDFSTSAPGFVNFPESLNQGEQIISGYQPPNLVAQQSGLVSIPGIIKFPGSTTVTPDRYVVQNRPGFIQGDLNQPRAGTIAPGIVPNTGVDRSQVSSQAPGQILDQYQVNQRPGGIIGQSTTIAPSISSQGYPQYGSNLNEMQVTSTPSSIISPQGTTPGLLPSGQYSAIPSSNLPQSNLPQGQSLLPQGFIQSGSQRPPQNQYQLNKDGKIIGNIPQTQRPGQQQLNVEEQLSQQYPSQTNQSRRPGQDQIFSMTSPTTPIPNYSQFPSSTSSAFASTSPTETFPSSPTYPGTSGQVQSGLISLPERPLAESDRNAVILNYDNVITPEGYFAYSFDTSNGIHADESGTAADGVRANGSYSYIGDDGKLYSIVYTADENGFRPQGDHLPTPPPIPEAIQKVIEQAVRDKEAGISDDGTYDEDKYGHRKFQGGRRPQKQRKNGMEKSSIPDLDESQFDQIDRNQPIRPYTESKKPTTSKGDIFNQYDDTNNEKDQFSEDDLDNQGKERPISKVPTRRPISRFQGQNEEKYAPDFIFGDSSDRRRPVGKIPVRPPSKPDQADLDSFDEVSEYDYESKKYNEYPSRRPEQSSSVTEDKTTFQDNRRRPVGKLPSRRPSDQFDDFITNNENSTFDEENDQPSEYRRVDKNMSRRPISSTYDPLSNQYVKSQDQRRFENVPVDKLDSTNRRVPGKFPSKPAGTKFDVTDSTLKTNLPDQPLTEQSVINISTESPKSYDRYNQYRGQPQVTTTFAPRTDDRRVNIPGKILGVGVNEQLPAFEQKPSDTYATDKFDIERGPNFASDDNESYVNKPYTVIDMNQNVRRPITSQRPRPNEYITARPSDNQDSAIISKNERKPQLNDNRFTGPTRISNLDQTDRKPTFTQRPGEINQYSTTRPSIDQKTIFNGNELDDSQTFVPGKIYQTIRRPGSDQRFSQQNRYMTVNPVEEESGYQYIPPQTKFEDIPNTDFERKGGLAKPFMTPDVTRHEEDYYDIEGNKKQFPPSSRPGQNAEINRPLPQREFEAYNQNGRTDLTKIPDEPNKYSTIGSTRLPSQTTDRPQQFGQQFEPTRVLGKDRDTTGIVPSSTTIPSQSTRFEVTQPIRRPGQQITDRFTTEKQDYNIDSTTKMPLQGPGSRFEVGSSKETYQQTPSGFPYQTTYKPMVTIDSNANRENFSPDSDNINAGSLISTLRPSAHSQGQVPSTTYRPGYFTQTIDGTKRPILDAYGRPTGSNVGPEFDGTTIRPGTGSQLPFTDDLRSRQPSIQFTDEVKKIESGDTKPGLTKYGRPITPSEQQRNDSSFFSPYEGSSSTEKVIGEDFSGPKQAQRFDPERGYYY